MSARLTENAVMVTESGSIAYVRRSNDPTQPDNNKKKIAEIFDPLTGAVVKATPIVVNSLPTLLAFITGFNGLKVEKRSGYDQYYNSFGPTNPHSPRDLTTQGVIKMMTVFATVLHERIAKGGAIGEEAAAAVKLLAEYNEVAAANIRKTEQESLLSKAAGLFTPAEIAAAKARIMGTNTPQTATVDAADVTETDDAAVEETAEAAQ